MTTAIAKVGWLVALMSVNVAALAGEAKPAPPQEPAGFITGGVIGGLAAGPVGAVIGAGIGTWLGNRVHRAGEAKQAEAEVAALRTAQATLNAEKASLAAENVSLAAQTAALTARNASLAVEEGDLSETNRDLTARLDQLSHSVDAAQSAAEGAAEEGAADEGSARESGARMEAAQVLDGLQGDVLFRTGSADIEPAMVHGLQVLADAVAKSPALKVRVDGYADPRGTADANLKLSAARAQAVSDVFLAAGVDEGALEINAYGKSQSVASDLDGYALERHVRLTLQAPEASEAPAVARQPGGPTPALQASGND